METMEVVERQPLWCAFPPFGHPHCCSPPAAGCESVDRFMAEAIREIGISLAGGEVMGRGYTGRLQEDAPLLPASTGMSGRFVDGHPDPWHRDIGGL